MVPAVPTALLETMLRLHGSDSAIGIAAEMGTATVTI
jgi:hypothetical protein